MSDRVGDSEDRFSRVVAHWSEALRLSFQFPVSFSTMHKWGIFNEDKIMCSLLETGPVRCTKRGNNVNKLQNSKIYFHQIYDSAHILDHRVEWEFVHLWLGTENIFVYIFLLSSADLPLKIPINYFSYLQKCTLTNY